MNLTLDAIVAGIGSGAVYGLVAVGYTVIYNATGIFNLAQGTLVMVGVMTSYVGLNVLGVPQVVALVAVLGVVTALSLVEERIAVRPFLRAGQQDGIGWFIATLAFALIVQTVV